MSLLRQLVQLYTFVIFARIILSWFPMQPGTALATIFGYLYRATEPVLGPIRRRMPHTGGIDLSPIVLFLGLLLLERIIIYYVYPNVF